MHEYRLELLSAAVNDLDHIADYYLQVVGSASAERVTDEILDALEHLKQFPYMGSLHPDPVLSAMEYRRLLSGDYVCVYKVIDRTVIIYRIVHGTANYPKYFYQ